MSHGWNSSAYQILNPGIQHWYNARGTGVVGYAERGKYLLVAGDPVCAPETLSRITSEFEEFAKRERRRVCYVCAAEPLRKLLARSREHSIVTLGAQPIRDPGEWASIIAGRASLRAASPRSEQGRQSGADGCRGGSPECRTARSAPTMVDLPPAASPRFPDRAGDSWRRTGRPGGVRRQACESGGRVSGGIACAGPERLPDRDAGPVQAGAQRHQRVLVDAAMRRFAREARTYVTMGLVALVRNAVMHNPLWLRNLMGFARAHANRLYNFRGLEHFRVKMFPAAWEESYLISKERRFSPRSLYAVGGGFSGMSPVRAICSGVLKIAARQIVAQ